jgi:short-subunit dehydrogenase
LIKNLLPKSLVLSIGSGAGVIPMRGRAAYCTSKFGLRGLMLTLAEEYQGQEPKFCLITLGSTMTSFGPLSIEEKKEKQKNGSPYFTPEWVADKLVEIIKDDNREVEYTLYPGDYGLGTWQKP